MINTKCRWCKRDIVVHNWEPFSNEYLEHMPIICNPCRVEYEAGWLRRLIQRRIKGNEKHEEKEPQEWSTYENSDPIGDLKEVYQNV